MERRTVCSAWQQRKPLHRSVTDVDTKNGKNVLKRETRLIAAENEPWTLVVSWTGTILMIQKKTKNLFSVNPFAPKLQVATMIANQGCL